jgi:hypothetical protein
MTEEAKVKRLIIVLFAAVFLQTMALHAFADSSGNFTAMGTSAACTAQPATFVPANCSTTSPCPTGFTCSSAGVCTGGACSTDTDCGLSGAICSGGECVVGGGFTGNTLIGGTALTSFQTNIQTPNGQGTTLLIRPSLDTGLFTATKLTTTINNATADVGIQVCVFVDPTINGNSISGGLPVKPANCVIYDQRIQQVSNTLFSQLTTCAAAACTTDAGCAALGEGTCVIPLGATSGTCSLPNPTCNFETLLTTLSAHSFDFVVPMPGNGSHNVVVTWAEIGTNNNTAGGNTASCVGPALVTVQQVKNFKNDQAIMFNSN